MRKLFVSVPMNGRKDEDIKKSISKMHRVAEAITGEELELIDSFIEDSAPEDSKSRIWYLAKSIEKLAQADVFIGIDDCYEWSGCRIEADVAHFYGIEPLVVNANYVIEDYQKIRQEKWERESKTTCTAPTARF